MEIYKFKDVVDGNYAFVMAKSLLQAEELIKASTSISVKFIESKKPSELNKPIVLINNILPF